MSLLDRLSVRFTAFVLAIVFIGFAIHEINVGMDANNHRSTLDRRNADDKSQTQ
jgi:hypothetical protein